MRGTARGRPHKPRAGPCQRRSARAQQPYELVGDRGVFGAQRRPHPGRRQHRARPRPAAEQRRMRAAETFQLDFVRTGSGALITGYRFDRTARICICLSVASPRPSSPAATRSRTSPRWWVWLASGLGRRDIPAGLCPYRLGCPDHRLSVRPHRPDLHLLATAATAATAEPAATAGAAGYWVGNGGAGGPAASAAAVVRAALAIRVSPSTTVPGGNRRSRRRGDGSDGGNGGTGGNGGRGGLLGWQRRGRRAGGVAHRRFVTAPIFAHL